jgi:hypothetical protein
MPALPKIPTVPWEKVAGRIHRKWDPDTAPHHIIFAMTRAGKTHLITRGILPLCAYSRVLIIDVKGGTDPAWDGYGIPVTALPPEFSAGGGKAGGPGGPLGMWYRLVADETDPTSKARVRAALEQVQDEGHCVVIADETRALTESTGTNMGVGALVEALLIRGGSRSVSLVLASQSTAYAASSVKDQGAFLWVGATRDTAGQERIAQILGQPKSFAATLRSIPKRQFLYSDAEDAQPMIGFTSVP